jgi:hypothetical protein
MLKTEMLKSGREKLKGAGAGRNKGMKQVFSGSESVMESISIRTEGSR